MNKVDQVDVALSDQALLLSLCKEYTASLREQYRRLGEALDEQRALFFRPLVYGVGVILGTVFLLYLLYSTAIRYYVYYEIVFSITLVVDSIALLGVLLYYVQVTAKARRRRRELEREIGLVGSQLGAIMRVATQLDEFRSNLDMAERLELRLRLAEARAAMHDVESILKENEISIELS